MKQQRLGFVQRLDEKLAPPHGISNVSLAVTMNYEHGFSAFLNTPPVGEMRASSITLSVISRSLRGIRPWRTTEIAALSNARSEFLGIPDQPRLWLGSEYSLHPELR